MPGLIYVDFSKECNHSNDAILWVKWRNADKNSTFGGLGTTSLHFPPEFGNN